MVLLIVLFIVLFMALAIIPFSVLIFFFELVAEELL
jgi:hypothetical protein